MFFSKIYASAKAPTAYKGENDMTQQQALQLLKQAAESDYKNFNDKLINTKLETLGVRIPDLRKIADKIAKEPGDYFETADPVNYEEVMLYGIALAKTKMPPEEKFSKLSFIIEKFDNWAHVDCVISSFKEFKKNTERALEYFSQFLNDPGEFKKRCLVVFLMDFCLSDEFVDKAAELFVKIPQGQYYTDMGLAWAVSVGLVKQYEKFEALLVNKAFTPFVHNKSIQKAVESYRISDEAKAHLRSLKI